MKNATPPPRTQKPTAAPPPPITVIIVDRDADTLRPHLEELRTKTNTPDLRLEVIDRATAQTLERLQTMGVIQTTTRGTRILYPINNDESNNDCDLTAGEKSHATEHRRQAAKRLRLAKMLLDEDLADEARDSLATVAFQLASALTIEKRAGVPLQKLSDAFDPPLTYILGQDFLSQIRPLADAPLATCNAAKLRELTTTLEKLT